MAQEALTFAGITMGHGFLGVPVKALAAVVTVSTRRIMSTFYANPATLLSREGVQPNVKTTAAGMEIAITS